MMVRVRLAKASRRSIALVAFLALWEFLPGTLIQPGYLPRFSTVLDALGQLFATGEIWENLSISLTRSLEGFTLALLVGVPLGLLIGWFHTVEEYLDPLVQALRQTPDRLSTTIRSPARD